MKNYKYIAIDIDGTLLNDHDTYDADRLNRDIKKLQQVGVKFIVASGNSYDALQAILKNSPLVTDFVAENGGRLITQNCDVFSNTHNLQIIQQLLKVINSSNFPTPDLLSLSGKNQTFIAADYKGIPVPYYPHHAYFNQLSEIKEPIYNLNVNWFKQRLPQERIQSLVDELNRALAGKIKATYSGAFGIDILPANVDKAKGLKQLVTKYFGGKMNEVIAFGDTSNDIEMLQEVGCGVAMKNATADLLMIADRVTKEDNNHNGLLTEIEYLYDL